ncbi:alpha/beta hydrolase [Hoyosella sp. G463]|uniref:Alpha/beta hydrolase n=1 Tax=Lolliginicoccus lacisalsi TaxID=2742202 RepID=A0A927PL48_9ACTN|nr:alpha/beta hydrolase [Lolliginicoccus lacisalsi]
MTTWTADILGDDFEQCTIELGTDPDGEGEIVATLVRHVPPDGRFPAAHSAALYVHGYSDYFFQRHLAEAFAAAGHAFYAIDLRKCGRSQRAGLTPHFVTDLAVYDEELGAAIDIMRAELLAGAGDRIVVSAHSTGGLIVPLWLDRLEQTEGGTSSRGIIGMVLNSPWFDMQGSWWLRSVGTAAIDAVGRVQPLRIAQDAKFDGYGTSLHRERHGQWEFDTEWKPYGGYAARFGWLRAVRRGHLQLHRGLETGVPSLILRSDRTWFSPHYQPEIDTVDCVLDVRQIAKWSGCVGNRVSVVPITGARHDVFLSNEPALSEALRELEIFLEWLASQDARERGAEEPASGTRETSDAPAR